MTSLSKIWRSLLVIIKGHFNQLKIFLTFNQICCARIRDSYCGEGRWEKVCSDARERQLQKREMGDLQNGVRRKRHAVDGLECGAEQEGGLQRIVRRLQTVIEIWNRTHPTSPDVTC